MRQLREGSIFALPGFLLVALFLLWAVGDGGLAATAWYPGALFCLALVIVIAWPGRSMIRASRWAVGALVLLGAFAAWSFLSIAWADVRADAWDGANRSLLYVLVYAVFVLWSWSTGRAAVVLGTFSLSVAGLGAAALVRAADSSEPLEFFIDSRFVAPLGYANGLSALALIAFWPALALASRREVPVWARAGLLGAAGVLVELALLPQSRGALFAFPLAVVLFFALVPGRVRSFIALLPVAIAVLLSRDALLDVYRTADAGGAVSDALVSARNAVGLSFAGLVVVGALIALLDRFVTFGERPARIAAAVLAGASAIAVVGGVLVALLVVDRPGDRVAKEWREFKSGGYQTVDGESRFSAVGSNRYDFWRVALGEFKDHPVRGIGADNFAVPYVRERRSSEETRFPHSLEIMVLSQNGLVGTGLLAGFFVAALAAARKRASRQVGFARVVTLTLVASAGYWFLHASVDWFWELPALTGPALAFLGMAGSAESVAGETAARARLPIRVALSALAAVLALAAAASFALPWLSARETDRALSVWQRDPARAYELLDRARRLNPLSDHPDAVAGAIASRQKDWDRMRSAFVRSLERNEWDWYAHLELGLAQALLGQRDEALASLAEAQLLNPSEPIVREVRDTVRAGNPVDPDEIDRRFVRRATERLR